MEKPPVLDGVEGALELVDVPAADRDRLEWRAAGARDLERAGEGEVHLGGAAPGADAPELVLDRDRERAWREQREHRPLRVGGREHGRSVDRLAAGERHAGDRAPFEADPLDLGAEADLGAGGVGGGDERGDERRGAARRAPRRRRPRRGAGGSSSPPTRGRSRSTTRARAASASTSRGVSKRSLRKSATHIGATRASSSWSALASLRSPSPRRASSSRSRVPRGTSGGGGVDWTLSTSGADPGEKRAVADELVGVAARPLGDRRRASAPDRPRA